MVPTNHRNEATVLFIDPGVGYRIHLEGNRLITAIVPTFEFHANIPLTNRERLPGRTDFHDVIDLTGGVHVVFNNQSSLGMALATPVNHPRAFQIEPLVNFNFRF